MIFVRNYISFFFERFMTYEQLQWNLTRMDECPFVTLALNDERYEKVIYVHKII